MREFSTGSVRDSDEGKGSPALISPIAILRFSKHMKRGAEKYAAHNWARGQDYMAVIDSMQRHLLKFTMGASDEDHLSAIMFGCMSLMEFEFQIDRDKLPASLDNRRQILEPGEDAEAMLKALGAVPAPEALDPQPVQEAPESTSSRTPRDARPIREVITDRCPRCGRPLHTSASGVPGSRCTASGRVAVECPRYFPQLTRFISAGHLVKQGVSRVYLAGPMTGIEDWNRPAFDTYAAELRDYGLTVVVPGELDDAEDIDSLRIGGEWRVPDTDYDRLLNRDLEIIDTVDAIVLLPGWSNSKGVEIERMYSKQKGLPVYEAQDLVGLLT